MQSKAGVKGRSATSVSAGSSKLIVMKLLTLMLQLKTRSLFQLTTRGFLRGSKVVNAMQSANKRVEEEAYQASRMVHLLRILKLVHALRDQISRTTRISLRKGTDRLDIQEPLRSLVMKRLIATRTRSKSTRIFRCGTGTTWCNCSIGCCTPRCLTCTTVNIGSKCQDGTVHGANAELHEKYEGPYLDNSLLLLFRWTGTDSFSRCKASIPSPI